MKLYTKAVVVIAGLIMSPLSGAQTLPVCDSQAADADNDNFGWQFNDDTNAWGSCEVTAQSTPPPVIVNPTDGTPVTLTRAYWDPNVDIANRDMQCDFYQLDASNTYVKTVDGNPFNYPQTRRGSHRLTHRPLQSDRPYISTATGLFNQTDDYIPLWNVENGIYYGIAPLSESPYVEITSVNNGTDNAVRVWLPAESNDSTPSYHECYDLNGEALVPTGSPATGTGNPIADQEEIVVTLPVASPPETPFINLQTGQEVQLQEAYWNYNNDLALRRIMCDTYVWSGNTYEPNPFVNWNYVFHPHNTNSALVTAIYTDVTISISNKEWPIENGQLQWTREALGRVELADKGVRIWQSNESYRQCTSVKLLGVDSNYRTIYSYPNNYARDFFQTIGYPDDAPIDFKPSGNPPGAESGCDYTNALIHNGWGWNADTRESCPPLTQTSNDDPSPATDCDYTDAELNAGWGWDATNLQSCAPLPVINANCDYTNALVNNGWGWDDINKISCEPES